MNSFLLSSTGQGMKLRIKALIPLVVPILNNLGESWGVNIVPEKLDALIDALFIFIAAIMEVKGWVRWLRLKLNSKP